MSAPTDDLLERERELAQLDALVDEAVAGRGGLALIEGPAGIGKSRLLAALRERAADRMLVLGARCGELERDFSFGAVRQLFEPLLRADAGGCERPNLLVGAAAPAAGVLGGPAADDATAAAEGSFAVLHGLYWATLELAEERPLLLAFDDLQWSDRPSLRFLAYLARRLESTPVLVAMTVRSTDPGSDPNLLAEIAADPLCVPVRPGPLTDAAVAALVRARLGAPADARFCDACEEATGGNPLLLHQLLRALADDGVRPLAGEAATVREIGPRAVARSVLRRLTRLSPETLAVARAVAVLGDSASLAAVGRLAELEEPQVARAAGELARADILQADPPLGFVHPLVRDAVYRDLSTAERELAHGRAAAALAAAGAADQQVAAQLVHAPCRGDAATVALLRDAAREASRRGGPESAVTYLARALDEPPAAAERTPVLLELALAESEMSAPLSALHLREAYDGLSDPAARASACFALVQSLLFTGGASEGAELARRTAAELSGDQLEERRMLESMQLLAVSFGAADPDNLWARALAEPPPAGGELGTKLLLAAIAFVRSAAARPVAEVLPVLETALEGDVLLHSRNGMMWSAAMVALTLSESPRTRAFLEAARAETYRRGGVFATASVEIWEGAWLLGTGDLADAGDALREALRLQDPWGADARGTSWSRGLIGQHGLLSGHDAATVRAELGEPPADDDESDGAVHWRTAQARLLLREGDAAGALALAELMGRTSRHLDHPAWRPWQSLAASALARLGRREEALAAIDGELALAERIGAPALIGRTQRLRGELEGADGIERLRAAAELLAATPARLERAFALASLGGALRRAGHPGDAREPLRAALELAEACGAAPLVEQVRSDLYAAGARPRSAALAGAAALTAREGRVAELAAEGRTNREIAQTLFVTPKTVEVHLSSAYRKLDIRSRRELSGALASG
ncbi:AAA family ATPase [Conexibacter stalactiti]|uniref:AAA family ATPase n=1 Tax=Conexibacter stalactiti TaxID=1940611 RepID=A0ABU4HHD0_9ACTN|nr:AAA family ATPase [Conexibacter stalactiti]MDW5592723.1 AAA family ATPase [Conexibacter stalactiti]MEC5033364.1 AAA family ATPase [Conexibacter stalactiti]